MSQGERHSPRPTQGGSKISLGATIKEKFRQLAQFVTSRAARVPASLLFPDRDTLKTKVAQFHRFELLPVAQLRIRRVTLDNAISHLRR